MPKPIIKLEHNGESRYAEWSTILDAPSTWLMTRDQFEAYYLHWYGTDGAADLPGRMLRVERTGTSSMIGDTLEDLLSVNRAGPDEAMATVEEIWERYSEERT